MKVVLISANSTDTDRMLHYIVFHLGFHCLSKYPFIGSRPQRAHFVRNHTNCSDETCFLFETDK